MSDAAHGAQDQVRRRALISARHALVAAAHAAHESPCTKSKRGVAIFNPMYGNVLGVGSNAPPAPLMCVGDGACRAACGKVAVHAEEAAIIDVVRKCRFSTGLHMVHVKVVGEAIVPSGPPSCVECSKMILAWGIEVVWLLHDPGGLTPYEARDFHVESLKSAGLPIGQR